MVRICKGCGRRFCPKPKANRQLFHSHACQVAWHERTHKELARTEWHSPQEIVEAARRAMGGIDLDPASCAQANETVKANKFYSVREDGLVQSWFGKIWLNPPYGRFAPKFVERFTTLFAEGSVEQGVLLLGTHHLTTDWIGALLEQRPMICLPPKRLQFSGSTERPAHGSVLLGVGVNEEAFEEAFYLIGQIWIPYRKKKI